MGYSFDSSTNTTTFTGASINTQVTATTGTHVLHVKSWGNQGASCVADVTLNVVQSTTNVVVSNPTPGASVVSPFALAASGTQCQSQTIVAMGYSLDTSSNTTSVYATSLNTQVTATAGAHILHVKSWGNNGAACGTDISITVLAPPPASTPPTIPSNAIAVPAIQGLTNWGAAFDVGTSGSASGAMSLVASPTLSGTTRQFVTNYTDYGGERYHINIGSDTTATNFLYDTWIYLASPANNIANIEFDLNQVMANGQTVIYGFQCDGWSHTWDYTANLGTPTSPNDQWLHSTQTCNPQAWPANTWHHVQISYSRDDSGNVTYKSVWLDNVEQDLNVTVNSSFALGWAPVLLSNFQIDGMTSTAGTATVYMDNFVIYRW